MPSDPEPIPSRTAAAIAGLASGAAALGGAELLAGLLPGAASPIIAVGDLVIALQPPGAKQFVVDLVGEADKLVLNLFIAAVAVAITAGIGVLARTRPGTGAHPDRPRRHPGAGRRPARSAVRADHDPDRGCAQPSAIAIWLLGRLMRLAAERASRRWPRCPTGGVAASSGTSIAVVGVAAASGLVGRTLLDRGRLNAVPQGGAIPAPVETAPALPAGASLDVPELTPIVVPNRDFYRIDTALLVPRPDHDHLAAAPDRHGGATVRADLRRAASRCTSTSSTCTIACVSNEVGGDLVGNALWSGVRLKELLDRAGISPEATQIVGRAVDGFTVGFPTAWAIADDREPLVAVTMNGEPLPADHGYPARLIVPGLYGYVSATKWLAEIELTTLEAFDAYWVPLGWAKQAPILTQSRIDVPRDGARVEAGTIAIAGVAWAPDRGVGAVEVQIDEEGWEPAELSAPISDATWVQFVRRWEATSGDHLVRVRAIDGEGEIQTDQKTRPAPDGARGHHTIRVTVS